MKANLGYYCLKTAMAPAYIEDTEKLTPIRGYEKSRIMAKPSSSFPNIQ